MTIESQEQEAPQNSELRQMLARLKAASERQAADPAYQAELARKEAKRAVDLEAYKQRVWRDCVADYVPLRVARHVWEPKETPATRVVSQWISGDRSKDLVLRGGVGTGKSTAVAVGIKAMCEPGVAWGEFGPQVTTSIKNMVTWLRPDALVSAVMHAYDAKAPKLNKYIVVDDLGRETRSEFVEAFCDLLDREGHTLIITTNLTRDEMRKRYDIRVLDRLNERAVAFDIQGDSMRSKQGGFWP